MKTSIVLWIIGVVLLGLAVFFYQKSANFREDAVLVSGTIVSFTYQGENETQSCPVVRYSTESGETIDYFSNQCTFGKDLGDEMELYYDPNGPENVQMKSFTSTWLAALLLGVPGLVLVGLGFGLMPKKAAKTK